MATVTDPLAEYPADMIERAGRSIWYWFRRFTEVTDCVQEAWLCYFTYRTEFDEKIAAGEERYVEKAIRRWVGEYARRQKAGQSGYQASDEQFYTRRKVSRLLEFFLHSEQVPSGGSAPEAKVSSAPSDGTESHVELLDIGRAWEQLDQGSRDVLWRAYGPTGEEQETFSEGDRQRARRALGSLLDILNGHP